MFAVYDLPEHCDLALFPVVQHVVQPVVLHVTHACAFSVVIRRSLQYSLDTSEDAPNYEEKSRSKASARISCHIWVQPSKVRIRSGQVCKWGLRSA
jgi:hypothetical protein